MHFRERLEYTILSSGIIVSDQNNTNSVDTITITSRMA
jgi:hypothetical protein